MKKATAFMLVVCTALVLSAGQIPTSDTDFKLALPNHRGQLRWHADRFRIAQSSAKTNGQEIGIRGKDESGRLMFLGFLFVVSGQGSLTSEKCREGEIGTLRRDPAVTILERSEIASSSGLPVSVVTYRTRSRDGNVLYSVRGFVATSDICGDLEVYSGKAINREDSELKKIFKSFHFDANYSPVFNDVFLFAQTLYQERMYQAAAPFFEQSLEKLTDEKQNLTLRRVATDQAGMAYGISGNTEKARSIFESAIARDPDYPMYYYNLACADAQDKNLVEARTHLQEAFARKSNMLRGETLPDPSRDDSFLPYRNDKEFWKFVESLH